MGSGRQAARTVLYLVFLLFTACTPDGQGKSMAVEGQYFDVRGLLEQQEAQLRSIDGRLHKKAIFSGIEEESSRLYDSLMLAKEFNVFREVDINKPVFKDRYHIERQVEKDTLVTTYLADDEEELNVNYLKVFANKESGEIHRIEALFSSKNILYKSTRLLTIEFTDIKGMQLPHFYSVEGSQKMIFNDVERYFIKADFDYGIEKDSASRQILLQNN